MQAAGHTSSFATTPAAPFFGYKKRGHSATQQGWRNTGALGGVGGAAHGSAGRGDCAEGGRWSGGSREPRGWHPGRGWAGAALSEHVRGKSQMKRGFPENTIGLLGSRFPVEFSKPFPCWTLRHGHVFFICDGLTCRTHVCFDAPAINLVFIRADLFFILPSFNTRGGGICAGSKAKICAKYAQP
jgi:hypothetical protein